MSLDEVVRGTTVVAAAPEEAFHIFTEEVDAWWRHGPRFRFRPGQSGVMRFEAVESGTRVSIEHTGFAALAAEHPVRHGLVGPAFTAMMGLWWADLLLAARSYRSSSS